MGYAGGGDGKKISKTIGWLNKNLADQMAESITFNEVAGPLNMMGEREACKLLKEFEEKASEIKNPTRWIKSAAEKKAHVSIGGDYGGGDGKKISKTIGWLNKNLADQMAEPITFNEVAGPLNMMGEREAC